LCENSSMPPPTEAEPVRVELGPLRELLAVDRKDAGERRRAEARRDLATTAYSMPLRVQWRRAWRRNRRLRVTTWSVSLSLVAALLLWQAPLLSRQMANLSTHVVNLSIQVADSARRAKSAATLVYGLWQRSSSWKHLDSRQPLIAQLEEVMRWATNASGMAHGLWLQSSSSHELSASERPPAP
jgi:hypothetical protein